MAEYMNEENRYRTKAGLWLNKSLQTKCANLQVGSVSRRPRVWLPSVTSAGVTRSGDDAAQRAAVGPAGQHQRHLCFVEKHHFVFVWQHGPPSDTPTRSELLIRRGDYRWVASFWIRQMLLVRGRLQYLSFACWFFCNKAPC